MNLTKEYITKNKIRIHGEVINTKCEKCGSNLIKTKETRPSAFGQTGEEVIILCPNCDF